MPDNDATDHDILVSALEKAARDFREKHPRPTIIGPTPDETVIEPIAEAIERCRAFRAVAGHVLYSGCSGPILHSSWLATRLFDKGARWEQDIPGAVQWLLRVLTTRETLGFFKAAVWGFSLDRETTFSDATQIVPFSDLPDSYMKSRISERAKRCYDGSMWLTHTYFDTPRAAFVKEVPKFPYIGADGAAFKRISQLEQEARNFWEFVEAASIGHPLAVGCWFEYADQELDLEQWENTIAWILPEIHPRIAICTPATGAAIQDDFRRYTSLPEELRSDLLRAMNRFTLSQCRRQLIDRILDLTLAFEIAVSGDGAQAPPSWKVSVRSAQIIGGPLKMRQENRYEINELYKLRNKATHGSSMKTRDLEKQEQIVLRCSEIFRRLIRSFLILGQQPEWNSLELEARTTS